MAPEKLKKDLEAARKKLDEARLALEGDETTLYPVGKSVRQGQQRPAARPREVDHRDREPAHRPRRGQPDLDAALRHAARRQRLRLRPATRPRPN